MSIIYLWKHREQPILFTRRWWKVWAKRILNSYGLFTIILRRKKYRIKGATLGNLTVVGHLYLNGPAQKLSIGEKTFLASGIHFALHEQVIIGNRVVINSGVQLLTASHDTADPKWPMLAEPIIIEDYAWIATNAIILPGVKIGKGAVVGAGAVVSHNVANFTVVAGNPASVIRQRSLDLSYCPVDFCAPYEAWIGSKI